mmetsp:Transcript_21875/g.60812  ORF Transcript_21875/g.60812 Transcript_21875/m.60812 type:complete len:345 (+) Transcript_21875:690-1724(+)
MLLQKSPNPLHKVGLQFLRTAQTLFFDACSALGAASPSHFGTFVASHVNVLGMGKEFHHFGQHVFQKTKRGFISSAVNVVGYGPDLSHVVVQVGPTAKFGVRRQHGLRMAGHFNFGNDIHVPFPGKLHHLPNVVLRIVSPVRCPIVRGTILFPVVMSHQRLIPPRRNGLQLGILGNFQPPPLIVRQVPVKGIHLVQGQGVDEFEHKRFGPKMSRHIHVHAPPGKPGGVVNGETGEGPTRGCALKSTSLVVPFGCSCHLDGMGFGKLIGLCGINLRWQELQNGLRGIKNTLARGRLHLHERGLNLQHVSLGLQQYLLFWGVRVGAPCSGCCTCCFGSSLGSLFGQ